MQGSWELTICRLLASPRVIGGMPLERIVCGRETSTLFVRGVCLHEISHQPLSKQGCEKLLPPIQPALQMQG